MESKLDIKTCSRTFRSNTRLHKEASMILNTFKDTTTYSINALSNAIELETNYSKFCGGGKGFLTERAKAHCDEKFNASFSFLSLPV